MNPLNVRKLKPCALSLGATLGMVLLGNKMLDRRREADLSGQVVLITGGTSGLGYLLSREFAREGCRIVTCARDTDELGLIRRELESTGAELLAVQCDVAERNQVDQLVARATNHFGRVDVLVNNAGLIQVGPAMVMSQKDYEDAMNVMLWGTIYPTLAVLPQMSARRSGRIVNITSIGGKVSVPHLLPYTTAKFAQTGFSEGLRAELKNEGISVTTIVPGLMRTGSYFNAEFKGDEVAEYTLFSVASSLPLITMDAQRAAKQIVQATKRGDAERILSVPANLLARLHGMVPGLTGEVMGVADRLLLPDRAGDADTRTAGREIDEQVESDAHHVATTLGRTAADRFQPAENIPETGESIIDPRDT